MDSAPAIIWFRQDLRLADNPALSAACKGAKRIIPVYIHDITNAREWAPGSAARWWLHNSLQHLNASLNGSLRVYSGNAAEILLRLAAETGAGGIFWNESQEPWRVQNDRAVETALQKANIPARRFHGNTLYAPDAWLKDDGTPYRVFTPLYRHLLSGGEPARPLPAPENLNFVAPAATADIEKLGLLPVKIRWDRKLEKHWQPGENGARAALEKFLTQAVAQYKTDRDFPSVQGVSRLSPFLHAGEISPRQLWHAAGETAGPDAAPWQRQLVWREFSASLLYHFPDLPAQPLQKDFLRFPWKQDEDALRRWQRGETGFPIVDAGMRELWETGYMHNRVRMIVGSFLVKNLLLHWHEGERWFWDTLVDADLANNSASWQWIAGCGADAAPYFRIFNPVLQSRKFDAEGAYIKRWVPELAGIDGVYIHAPWEAPPLLRPAVSAYPPPIGEHAAMRDRALQAYQTIK